MLPAPTAPSEGSAGVRSTLVPPRKRFATPLLDPGSPAQASLPIVQRPLARSPADLLDCATRRFAGLSTGPAWRSNSSPKTVIRAITARRSAALLGVTTLASRFAHPVPKNPRAASRERRSPHPAPLPDWPRQEPESSSQLPAGGDRSFCRLPLPSVPFPVLPGRRGLPSRSPTLYGPHPRVAEAESSLTSLWITGILGTTVRTSSQTPIADSPGTARLPFRSPLLTS